MARLYWCGVDQIAMQREILRGSDFVFPIPPLPNPFFFSRLLQCRAIFGHWERAGKRAFDKAPPGAVICVTFGQYPKSVYGGWQNDNCINLKWITLERQTHCLAQQFHFVDQQSAVAVSQARGEKICRPRGLGSDVI